MRYLLAQPANQKFKWELDVLLTNIRSMDEITPIVLLFLEEDFTVPNHFRKKYRNVEIHVYPDKRSDVVYLPAIRPYLCWNYFSEFPEAEQEDYFQIDSDIIFRELPNFSKLPMDGKVCWASDCGSYIGYDYILSCKQGNLIMSKMVEQFGLTDDVIKAIPAGGAQWLITKPTAALWLDMYKDSIKLRNILSDIDSNIQKWTAEMWAELYDLTKLGWQVKISPELDFCRPTDNISLWSKVKILHNAGVVADQSHKLFYKGEYLTRSPFKARLDYVDKTKASKKYVEAIQNVVN